MKNLLLILTTCVFVHAHSIAQDFPTYGTITREEMNLKEVPFDKEADAVILIHEAFSIYDDNYHLITNHHIRIKILKEKGFSAADISIPFYRRDDFEQIIGVEGMTLNEQDGKTVITMLERKSIFTEKTNDRVGKVVFAFPAIKAGSIIEYRYRSEMKNYGGLEDWSFQDRLPVVLSKYNLVVVPNTEFAYRARISGEFPIKIDKTSFNNGITFEMSNIPGLGDEPYMDAREDYVQKVVFQLSSFNRGALGGTKYMTSWDEVTRELTTEPNFGRQLEKNIPETDEFIKRVKALPLPEDRMKAVFFYVRNNMVWNHLYSKFTMEGVKDAWQKKSGTSGEINLILVNLLKQAELEAYPMLVSERFHGKVDPVYPFIDQFNSVFAFVTIGGKKYYLDATDKSVPPHITPADILNTTAFIVNRKAGGLTNITNDTVQYQEYIAANLALDSAGGITGSISVTSKDYARLKKLPEFQADKERFIKRYCILDGTNITPKGLVVSNTENDSLALQQDFTVAGSLNQTGDYSFLPLNLYTGFDVNPFLSENRFSNINFGYRRFISMISTIRLPANYVVDELPKSVRVTNPDKDINFTRQLEFDKENNLLRCMILIEFKKSLYEADTYPVIKDVYQKIFELLKEPVLLKKK